MFNKKKLKEYMTDSNVWVVKPSHYINKTAQDYHDCYKKNGYKNLFFLKKNKIDELSYCGGYFYKDADTLKKNKRTSFSEYIKTNKKFFDKNDNTYFWKKIDEPIDYSTYIYEHIKLTKKHEYINFDGILNLAEKNCNTYSKEEELTKKFKHINLDFNKFKNRNVDWTQYLVENIIKPTRYSDFDKKNIFFDHSSNVFKSKKHFNLEDIKFDSNAFNYKFAFKVELFKKYAEELQERIKYYKNLDVSHESIFKPMRIINDYDHNFFMRKEDGLLYFKSKEAYELWWINNYEKNTGCKYVWWLPKREYSWNVYRPYVDKFMSETLEIFWYQGFLKGLYSHFIVLWFFCFVIIWLMIVFVSAVLTLDERKFIATIQNRHGPARVGFSGLLQPIADALKMLIKEFIKPHYIRGKIFRHSSFLSFFFASFFWVALPYNGEFKIILLDFTLLFVLFISLLHAYCILAAGWSSNSKYSFLGGVRTAAQLISYDISLVLGFVLLYYNFKTFNLEMMTKDQFFSGYFFKFAPWIMFSIIIMFLAESSRHPYDLPEAEAELVSGYNVEYSAIRFAMFFLAEYSAVVYVSILFTCIFMNPNSNSNYTVLIEMAKISFIILLCIWLRSLIPRYRYDQLMRSCWKSHIPIGCGTFLINLIIYFMF